MHSLCSSFHVPRHSAHLFAVTSNALFYRYVGRKLPAELRKDAEQWLGSDMLAEVILLENREEPFPRASFEPAFIEKLTPRSWWLGLARRPGVSTELCEKALAVMQLPPSSASIERAFSTFAIIQAKLRNRLGATTLEKLSVCHMALRGRHNIEW